jgi:hypothetical protein
MLFPAELCCSWQFRYAVTMLCYDARLYWRVPDSWCAYAVLCYAMPYAALILYVMLWNAIIYVIGSMDSAYWCACALRSSCWVGLSSFDFLWGLKLLSFTALCCLASLFVQFLP